MTEGLIRVREFAQNCGCTPQNIYGHLKTYAQELEGHTFQGKGRQGVLLDGYAQEFLRSIMYPKEIADNALMDEINKLRAQLLQMGVENTRLASQLAVTEGERDRAVLEAGQIQRALTATQEAEEAKAAELQELQHSLDDTKHRLQASEDAQRALEASRDEFKLQAEKSAQEASENAQEAANARLEAEDFRSRLEAAEARERALKGRTWWERLTRKGE